MLYEVLTTEKVPFSYRVAGLGSRFLAWMIDFALIVLLLFVGFMAAGVLEMGRGGPGTGFFAVWFLAVSWGYFAAFEWLWHGQTPGKFAMGIRVIQLSGAAISFHQAAVRNIVRFVDTLPPFLLLGPGLVGFAAAACNQLHRRLGDLAAGTLVVHVERRAGPIRSLTDLTADQARDDAALVRQRLNQLSRQQKQTLLDLCLRREQLRVQERARLFGITADYFRRRLELAAHEHQSDEKFVLQLAAVLGSATESDRNG